ncbi:glycoside hydrolase family 13 protein [Actinocrispum wychmicini]|uniref:Alpha-glucosidase n=1 Tax=Actinocrispum wychmicini TaxID=1213861 RepID=A0A4V2S815_9PSEU|nr:alpha-amylase family glycosyl hydrolase [Actinocrispum wychmicini]TCO62150.1 alpha-glucosidase [Actinocrispum wychmicini]
MTETPWWHDAVVYHIYPRSFADENGDGIGDLAGVRSSLDHLVDLGVNALWLSPFYPSPMADGGYDVADYRDVDPRFGDLDDFDALVSHAAWLGIRVIVDIVPNHCSTAHPLFQQAMAAGPGSPERELFVFREGRGPAGDEPPNNWPSSFGGPAWTRVPDGQYYLHLFDSGQPDWNWRNPAVPAMFEDVLRFWLDRGVAGLRIDVASALYKDPDLPDLPDGRQPRLVPGPYRHRVELHELYRSWRTILESYPDDVFPGRRTAIGEIYALPEDLAPYVASGGLPQLFNFFLLFAPWDAAAVRAAIETVTGLTAGSDMVAPWVLGNHDVARMASRYGWQDPIYTVVDGRSYQIPNMPVESEVDTAAGARRARAAALLMLALPGSAYIYQGDELGLPEVFDIPDHARDDPIWWRSSGTLATRDGCRVPLPWSGGAPPYGFSPDGMATWLPQPTDWADYTVAAQLAEPDSTLNLYRAAISTRPRGGPMAWVDTPADTLRFTRGDSFTCLINLGSTPVPLPPHHRVLLASGRVDDQLPPDTAVWLKNPEAE